MGELQPVRHVRIGTGGATAEQGGPVGRRAWEFKDELAARKVSVVLGQVSHQYVSNEEIPDGSDYPKPDERLAGRLTNPGIPTAMATFSRAFGTLAPAGTGKWLLIDAAVAAGYGMTDEQVLRAVTLVPAQILGVADRVGSLEVGKDADVIVLDGPPLSVKTWVQRVYVNGELVYHEVTPGFPVRQRERDHEWR